MPVNLLIADDSVTFQRVIALTFDAQDVQVIAVGDGGQAIRRIDADAPDIVLADVGMPGADGYEVSAHIKQSPALRHIPVLLLAGAFDPIDEAKAASCGCDGVLVKPFEPKVLASRVAELLAGRAPRASATMISRPADQVGPGAGLPPLPAAPLGPRSVPVTSTAVHDAHAASEFARDLDALRRSPADGSSAARAWDVVVRPSELRDVAGASHDFDLDTGGSAATGPDHGQPRRDADVPRDAAVPPATRKAPPEWDAELLREPATPVSEPAMGASDFGDWDLPVRPVPIEHPDDHELAAFSAGGDTAELSESPRAGPAGVAVPAPAPEPPPSVAPAERPASAALPVALPPQAMPSPSQGAASRAPRRSGVPRGDVSLAKAFAELLSAEQQQPAYRPAGNSAVVSDAVIDEVVRRVVARLSDDAVQRVVLDTAERLVRDEIEKIKANPE